MDYPENAKLALDVLKENYKEITDINKRTGDRTTIVLGAVVTSFGLITKLSEGPVLGVSFVFLCLGLCGIATCFIASIIALFPKSGEQPGSTDVDFIWNEYVSVGVDAAYANTMSDLCRVLKSRRKTGIRMAWWFRCVIIAGAFTLVCIAISEATSANG